MPEPEVLVFFYGSYMNRRVLADVGLVPRRFEVATLAGFDITIAPRANLIRAADERVVGVLASATHAELDGLYAHARDTLGEVYLPEAVLVRTAAGSEEPALCYLAPRMQARPPERDYVERILAAARELAFPAAYRARLESFLLGAR